MIRNRVQVELVYFVKIYKIIELVWSDKAESLQYECTADEQYLCWKKVFLIFLF